MCWILDWVQPWKDGCWCQADEGFHHGAETQHHLWVQSDLLRKHGRWAKTPCGCQDRTTLLTSLTSKTHSELCQVEGHRVEVDDGQSPSWLGCTTSCDAPAKVGCRRVYCLAEKGNLLWIQVNQHVVSIQRRAHDHLHIHRRVHHMTEILNHDSFREWTTYKDKNGVNTWEIKHFLN